MTSNKTKYMVRILSIALVLSIMTPLITPVYATDTIDDLEQSTSDLENELSGLNSELDQLSADITSIADQIKGMNARIEEVQAELAIAKGEEEAQYAAMKTRIKYMYENGSSSLFEILLSASSMADFLSRAEFFSSINEYDRKALKKLEETRESIASKETQLAEEQKNLTALQEELKEKESALTSRIAKTSDDLASYTAQLKKAQEEAKKTEETLKQEIKPITSVKPNTSSNTNSSDTNSEADFDYAASASDIELFAALIECEAGSTDYEGMLAVASVVVNRMNNRHYPDTLRGVIYQSGQFTPAHNGKLDKVLKRGVKDSCITVANDALAGKNNVGDCLSFRSANSGHTGIIIGGNVFF